MFRVGEFDDNNVSKSYYEDAEVVATAMEMVGQSQKIVPGSLKDEEVDHAPIGNGT